MRSTRLLIADDQLIILQGLQALLEQIPGLNVVGMATDGQEILDMLSRRKVDLVIMDYEMPLMNGCETTEKIKTFYPEVKVLILTMHNKAAYIRKMIEAGAAGYVLKGHGIKELARAIDKVNRGEEYFGESVQKVLIQSFRKNKKGTVLAHPDITPREQEILSLIAEGQSTPEIAHKLCIAPSTVNTHRRNLIDKLGVANIKALVRYAVQNGFA